MWEAATAGIEPVPYAEPLPCSDIVPSPGPVASLCLAFPRQSPPRAGILPQGSPDASMARRASGCQSQPWQCCSFPETGSSGDLTSLGETSTNANKMSLKRDNSKPWHRAHGAATSCLRALQLRKSPPLPAAVQKKALAQLRTPASAPATSTASGRAGNFCSRKLGQACPTPQTPCPSRHSPHLTHQQAQVQLTATYHNMMTVIRAE